MGGRGRRLAAPGGGARRARDGACRARRGLRDRGARRPPGGAGATALSASTQAISETGSSLLYPLAQRWAAGYQRTNPGVTVSTASTSSGKGITAASAGTADIGASDAYLSSGDVVKNQKLLLNIPLVISAQTVIYNLPSLPPWHPRQPGRPACSRTSTVAPSRAGTTR